MTNRKLHKNYALSIDTKIDDLGWPWSAVSSNFEDFRGILQISEALQNECLLSATAL